MIGDTFKTVLAFYASIALFQVFAIRGGTRREKFLIVALLPLLPLIFLGYLLLAGLGHYYLQDRQLRRQMRRAGRFLEPSSVHDQVLTGTIILDRAACNHDRDRLWWTPDDVLALAPAPPSPRNNHGFPGESTDPKVPYRWPAFDRWVFENYLDPVSGTGHLMKCTRKPIAPPEVAKEFPGCKIAESFSAGKFVEAHLGSASAEPPPKPASR